jgi:hypothetical protein
MNMEMLTSDKSWKSDGLIMARIWLVVAMRHHTQPSSFRLGTLSNTSPCSEQAYKWDPLLI